MVDTKPCGQCGSEQWKEGGQSQGRAAPRGLQAGVTLQMGTGSWRGSETPEGDETTIWKNLGPTGPVWKCPIEHFELFGEQEEKVLLCYTVESLEFVRM